MRLNEPRSVSAANGRARKRVSPLFVCLPAALAVVALLTGCGTLPPRDWQWWTSADSIAVQQELATFSDFLNARHALADTLRLDLSTRVAAEDTVSATGDTVYKFAHLIAVWTEPSTGRHVDAYTFGVSADTVALTDSFCQVEYCDTLAGSTLRLRYDSLWVIGFRPDTVVDTTTSPPETSVVYRRNSTELRGFATPVEATKSLKWSAYRAVFLKKTDGKAEYTVKRITGFGSFVPTSQDAPSIRAITLAKPGAIDSVFLSARKAPDNRGIYNLKSIDTLYTLRVGEQVDITVELNTAATPEPIGYRFYAGVEGRVIDISSGTRGVGTISFTAAGRQHIYIQVVPLSAIAYTSTTYKTLYWAIPVSVIAAE